MIFDHLRNAPLYSGLGPRFAAAFRYLEQFDPAMPDGKYPLEGDLLFAVVQSYQTEPAAERIWESHRVYADIQYIVAGEELVYHRALETLIPRGTYDPARDLLAFEPRDDQSLILPQGYFVLFYPHDAHKPSCAVTSPAPVRKVLMKVRLG